MATKKQIADQLREADARKAEHLAECLTRIAKRIRRPADLPPEKGPCTDEEAAEHAAKLQKLLAVLRDEPPIRNETPRDTLLALCQHAGTPPRELSAHELKALSRGIAKEYALRFPGDRALVSKMLPKIAALVAAHARNTGGKGKRTGVAVTNAVNALTDQMGYPADRDTIRRTARRRATQARKP
jgi:hypothetical protein